MKQGEIIYKMVRQYNWLRIIKYKVLASNDNNTVIELADNIMPSIIFKDYEIIKGRMDDVFLSATGYELEV